MLHSWHIQDPCPSAQAGASVLAQHTHALCDLCNKLHRLCGTLDYTGAYAEGVRVGRDAVACAHR